MSASETAVEVRAAASDGEEDASAALAITVSESVPQSLAPVTSASPRAAAMAMRTPVKLPGPSVAAMTSRAAKSRLASSITEASIGIKASAWPRVILSPRQKIARDPPFARSTAAPQAPMLVSSARMSIR